VIAIALDGGVGGMVELGCETDFVARTDDFSALADALASAVVTDGSIERAEALLEAEIEGEKVEDRMTAAVAKFGENVVLKRAARLEVEVPGIAGGYVHAGGKLGVLVGLRTSVSEPAVEGLAKDLAMHVAAADPSPLAVDQDGISPELLESERNIYRKQAEQEGKPEKVIDRIVEGKLGRFTAEVCLLGQAFVKDPDRSVGDLLRDVAKEVGAEIEVSGFRRFKLGEASDA
jgi:elongation factor Ts